MADIVARPVAQLAEPRPPSPAEPDLDDRPAEARAERVGLTITICGSRAADTDALIIDAAVAALARFVMLSGCVVVLGGATGTAEEIDLAAYRGTTIVPMPASGGAATPLL